MKYRVMMTRCDGDYKMVVAPEDTYIGVGDLVRCCCDSKTTYREVVMTKDWLTSESVKEFENLLGYRFERVEECYTNRAVEWEEEDDGENVPAAEG